MSATTMIADDCARSLAGGSVLGLAPLRDTHLVVTGGSGFVGTWLANTVACLNDRFGFNTRLTLIARRRSRFSAQLSGLESRPDVHCIAADVRQLVELPGDASWVIHAAGNPDNRQHATAPIETAAAIAEGTARVLTLADQLAELRSVLHFSSALVGGIDTGAGRSSASSVYADAKRFSEALCAAHRTQSRTPVIVTRPFTFLGPFQQLEAPWAANNFLHAALAGQPLKILGGGESVRTYMYGSDMAVLALLQLVRGRPGETYDLGGITPVTLQALAEIVVGQAKRPLEIRMNTAGRDVGVSRLVPNPERGATEFAFAPAFTPVEAVARTLAWHRDQARASQAA